MALIGERALLEKRRKKKRREEIFRIFRKIIEEKEPKKEIEKACQ